MKTCILPIGHSYDHLFVALKSGPTPSQCAKSEPRCPEADREAADRYRALAANNPSLRREYLKRATECDRIAAIQPQHSETDIPAEWRNDLFENYGEIVEDFAPEESAAVELDRR